MKRTGDSKFTLIVINHPGDKYDPTSQQAHLISPSVFQRCRALTIFNSEHLFPTLKPINDLSALEKLELYGDTPLEFMLSLLPTIERSSLQIRHFRAHIDTRVHIGRFSLFLSRLTTLDVVVVSTDLPVMTMATTSVKTLKILSVSSHQPTFLFESPSQSLRELSLRDIHWKSISLGISNQITHLSLRFSFKYSFIYLLPSEFPNLGYLSIATHLEDIRGIQAPKLQTLVLDVRWEYSYVIEYQTLILLQPELLDFNIDMTEQEARRLIWQFWRNLKALRIVYRGGGRSLRHPLASWLRNKEGQGSMCPRLERLSMLSPMQSDDQRLGAGNLLRGVGEALKTRGLLKELKYGWYEPIKGTDPRECTTVWSDLMT